MMVVTVTSITGTPNAHRVTRGWGVLDSIMRRAEARWPRTLVSFVTQTWHA